MLNNSIKFIAKFLFMFVFWTFAFSIQIQGKTVFEHANKMLVKNIFVQNASSELLGLLHKISETSKTALKELSQSDGKKS